MAKRFCLLTALPLLFVFCTIQRTLAETPHRSGFKPGARFEYFSRTIGWDEDKTSDLAAYQASLLLEYEIQEGLSLAGLIGYSSASFEGLIFRRLPFSFEVPATGMGSLLLGGEINWNLISGRAFRVGALGKFLASLSQKKKWEISDYAVPGTLEGQPAWMWASVGPIFLYKAGEKFSPYLYPSFNYLWGTYTVDEKFETLTGNEQIKIKGKSRLGVVLGSSFGLSEKVRFKVEGGLYPFKDGTDYSLMVQSQYAF